MVADVALATARSLIAAVRAWPAAGRWAKPSSERMSITAAPMKAQIAAIAAITPMVPKA